MSKLVATISGLACFVWVCLWSWILPPDSQDGDPKRSLPSTSISVSDSIFSSSSTGIFSFHQSDATPVIPAENLMLFQELAQHLSNNSDRKLELNGYYTTEERNQTPYPNLGIARAKAIEKLLVSQGASEAQLFCTGTAWQSLYLMDGRILGGVNFIFSENDESNSKLPEPASGSEKKEPVQATSNMEAREEGVRQFFYDKEVYKLASMNRAFLDSLRQAMRQNPDETLIISGFSQPKEEQEVPGNLAELRAKAVRRYLVDNGLRRKQIVVVSHPGSGSEESERRVELKVERD